jgi:sulfide:quinone oxidoreductase
MTGKTVLVLGGGTGGLVAASRLRRMLDREHRIVLVDRSPYHTFEPSFTWVMLGKRKLGRITRELKSLEKKGIEVRTAEITAIDLANKKVALNPADEIAYDYLVIALGVDYSAEEVPGLNRAWTFYHADGVDGLAAELPKFTSGRIAITVPVLPYKCPPAPYEAAMLLDDYFRGRKLREAVGLHVYTPEERPFMQAGPATGERILSLLSERGIGFTGGVAMKSVNHQKGELNFHETAPAQFDMLIASPIHRLPRVLAGTGLAGEDGWIAVDRDTLATVAPDVYAVGDCNSIAIADGQMLPKAGVFAHGEAEVVARNLTAEIAGKEPIWGFGGQGACFMETGRNRGAYIVGNYFQEPPHIQFRGPSRFMHWSKAGFERMWLWRWF